MPLSGAPTRSRQSRPVAGCPPAAVRPCSRCPPRGRVPTRSRRPRLWSGTRPQPATPRPWAAAVPWPGARALADGKMLAKCVPQRPTVAIYRRHAFPGVRPWQDIAAMRFRAAIRGSFFTSCVPEGPRMGKTPVRGNISPPCIRNELASARHARHASEKPCKRAFGDAPREDLAMKGPFSLRGPLKSCTARGSCRRSALAGRRALCVEGRGAGLRKRTPYCCRRSRVPARHLVAFCGGSLSRSKRLTLRHAALAVTIPRCDRPVLQPTPRPCRDRPILQPMPCALLPAAASHDLAHKKRPAFCWPFLRGYELSADYSARSFRRRSSSSASWWRLTLPDSVIGMASMNSMCSGRRRLATPMESRYSAMESSVGSTSPV